MPRPHNLNLNIHHPQPSAHPPSPGSPHSHDDTTPIPTPPPPGAAAAALYDPFAYRPRLPPTDALSKKWAYQARYLLRAQQAIIAAQSEVLKIEQDLLWTEREMWEKERRLFSGEEEDSSDGIGGDVVVLDKNGDQQHRPNRMTQGPRTASSNAPPSGPKGNGGGVNLKYQSGGHDHFIPGSFPSPTNINVGENTPKQQPPQQQQSQSANPNPAASSKPKPLPLRMPSNINNVSSAGGNPNRHSYHPGLHHSRSQSQNRVPMSRPIRADSIETVSTDTTDASDADAMALAHADNDKAQQLRARLEYERQYGHRSNSRSGGAGPRDPRDDYFSEGATGESANAARRTMGELEYTVEPYGYEEGMRSSYAPWGGYYDPTGGYGGGREGRKKSKTPAITSGNNYVDKWVSGPGRGGGTGKSREGWL